MARDLERIQALPPEPGEPPVHPGRRALRLRGRSGSSRRSRFRSCTARGSRWTGRRWCASWPRWRTSSAGSSPWCSTAPRRGSSRSPPTRRTELPGLRADSTRGKRFHGDTTDPPGWGEHTYNNRIRQEKQRHFEAIARELFAIDRRHPAHGIVLAGTGADARRGRAVPPQLPGRAGASAPPSSIPRRRPPRWCTRRRSRCARRYERASERSLVHEMLEGVGSGWARQRDDADAAGARRAARCARCWCTPTRASPGSAAATRAAWR